MEKSHPKVGVGIIVIKKKNGKTYVMLHKRKGARGLAKNGIIAKTGAFANL